MNSSAFNLFGLDLSVAAQRIALGVRQLVEGPEAGVSELLAPRLPVLQVEGVEKSVEKLRAQAAHTYSDGVAVYLPDSNTLSVTFDLPATAEVFIEDAVSTFIGENSPFDVADTVHGYSVDRESDDTLLIAAVMAKRSSVLEQAEYVRDLFEGENVRVEVWASVAGKPVVLTGYARPLDNPLYRRALVSLGLQWAGIAAAVMALMFTPGLWVSMKVGHYEELLQTVKSQAVDAVAERTSLIEAQDRINAANDFFGGHVLYRPWLNKIAQITPDEAFLLRLEFEADLLTLSGAAVNAADYQTILASSDLFSDLQAVTAFTRDGRTGKERFTFVMTASAGGDQ